ncbi:tetratricopeptide repeat protein [Elusimicrobiota bacterium]
MRFPPLCLIALCALFLCGCGVVKKMLARVYISKGHVCVRKGMHEDAIGRFTKAIEILPGFAKAYIARADAYIEINKPDKAVEDCSKALELEPDNIPAYVSRGMAHMAASRPKRAMEDCGKAVSLEPKSAQAHLCLGNVYFASAEMENALQEFDEAVALKPDYGQAYNNRAEVYKKLRNRKKAEDGFNKAISLNCAKAYYNRALGYPCHTWVSMARGMDPNEFLFMQQKLRQACPMAIDDLTRAVSIKPRFAMAYYRRAKAFLALLDFDPALDDFTQAVALDDRFSNALFMRGYTHRKKSAWIKYKLADDPEFKEYDSSSIDLNLKKALSDYRQACELGHKGGCAAADEIKSGT